MLVPFPASIVRFWLFARRRAYSLVVDDLAQRGPFAGEVLDHEVEQQDFDLVAVCALHGDQSAVCRTKASIWRASRSGIADVVGVR